MSNKKEDLSPRWLRAGKMMGVSLLLPSTVFCSQERQEWNSGSNNLVDYYWPSRQRNVLTIRYPASMSRCLPPSHLHTELARDQKWAELTEHRATHQQLGLSSDPLCCDPLVKSVTAKWVDKCIFMKIHITGFIQKYPYIEFSHENPKNEITEGRVEFKRKETHIKWIQHCMRKEAVVYELI